MTRVQAGIGLAVILGLCMLVMGCATECATSCSVSASGAEGATDYSEDPDVEAIRAGGEIVGGVTDSIVDRAGPLSLESAPRSPATVKVELPAADYYVRVDRCTCEAGVRSSDDGQD